MKACSIKENVIFNTLKASGVRDSVDVRKSIQPSKTILSNLRKNDFLVGMDNEMEIQADHSLVAKALEKIPSFMAYGLVVTEENNVISSAAKDFVARVLTTKDEAMGFINNINPNGFIMGSTNNVYKENGQHKAYDLDQLNKNINDFFNKGQKLKNNIVYVEQGKNGLVFANDFINTYNNTLYSRYLEKIGTIGAEAWSLKSNVPTSPELEVSVDDAIMELKTEPMQHHIDVRKKALYEQRRKNKIKGDASQSGEIEKELNYLTSLKKNIRTNTTQDEVLNYFYSILTDVDRAMADPNLSVEGISAALTSLKLVINASERDKKLNRTLSEKDMLDASFLALVQEAGVEAANKKSLLMERYYDLAINVVKDASGKELETEEVLSFGNMRTDFERIAQNVMGLHNIQNPAVQFIYTMTERALIKTSKMVETLNDELATMYDKIVDKGVDTKDFIQKDEKNRLTGYMIDVFNSRYWKTKRDLHNVYKLRQSDTLALNPTILFGEDSEQKKNIKATIEEWLGPYMAKKYLTESKRLWESYLAIEQEYIDVEKPTADQLHKWQVANSPVERINNFNHKIIDTNRSNQNVIAGSDDFLLIIPRKYDIRGNDLGYYDNTFADMQKDKDSMKFYESVRDNFIKNELLQNNYHSLFKPPALGYVGKGIAEELGQKNYGAAWSLLKKTMHKGVTTSLYRKAVPENKITGEPEMVLTSQLHSIPQEISLRSQRILSNNMEYVEADPKTKDGKALRKAIREQVLDQVSMEVEESRSKDLLQSITLSNFATTNFIEKAKIETELTMVKNLLKSGEMKFPSGKFDVFGTAEKTIQDSLVQYLGVRYYEQENKSDTTFLGEEARDKAKRIANGEDVPDGPERGVSSRSVVSSAVSLGRLLMIGYSVPTSIVNGIHGSLTGIRKTIQRKDLSLAHLLSSYGDILMPKNRAIIDNLYVLGDVAFGYDRRTIQARGIYAKIAKYGNPMVLQTATEKFVQGAMALSVMKSSEVVNTKTGEVTSVYKAMDDKGRLSDDWYSSEFDMKGEDMLVELTLRKIRPINMETSGDYLSPLMIEKNEFGKALVMFKKFIPELMKDRFGGRHHDHIQNRERMGTMRGVAAVSLKTLRGERGAIDSVEREAARGALIDIVIWGAFQAMLTSLTSALCTTKQCKEQQGIVLYMLNTLGRVVSDLLAFLTVAQLWNSISSPFAIEGLVDDMFDTLTSITEYVASAGQEGVYKQDTDFYSKGDPKFIPKVEALIPIWRPNVLRAQQMSNKLYNGSFWQSLDASDTKKKTTVSW